MPTVGFRLVIAIRAKRQGAAEGNLGLLRDLK